MSLSRESDLAMGKMPHLFKPVTPDRLIQAATSLLSEDASDGDGAAPTAATVAMSSAGPDLRTFGVRGNPVLWCRLSAIPLPELLQLMRSCCLRITVYYI